MRRCFEIFIIIWRFWKSSGNLLITNLIRYHLLKAILYYLIIINFLNLIIIHFLKFYKKIIKKLLKKNLS